MMKAQESMQSSHMTDIAIRVQNLSKCYQIYDTPRDRLKQFVIPKLCRAIPVLRKFSPLPTSQSDPTFYKEFWALKDVSFEIKKGETVGIIGRNGSGKSTLLQMICGTLFPTNGCVETHGRIAALLELGSGFNPEFTGRENVYLNGAVLGLSKEEVDARFDDIAAFADIGDFIEQPVKTYSSGMFVRLAFAIQANVDPEILIVDEALAVGDAYFVHRCMLRFNELQKSGTTILFVSHDANSVRNLCSRAIWLVDGGIREEGNSSKVVDAYLAHLFGRQVVTVDPMTAANVRKVDQEIHLSLQMETSIPNIDRRLGDQKCEIIGVGLYDESMNKIASSLNDKVVTLRLTIQNHSLDANTALAVGYIFRNAKGQEIASTNSQIEERIIKPIAQGSYLTVRIKVTLPRLHPGSYAFSPTAGYLAYNQEIILSDRIENAIVFDIMSSKEMHTMMAFPSVIEVESREVDGCL
jgi:lipopolysaccharide transport system ATP-binding protein